MRTLHLYLVSTLILAPTLACSDDGGTEASGGETAAESGTGDGDGDGDGETGTDSNTTTGDGDGDGDPTTTGDGDGDPTTTGDGDGDGDMGCIPPDDTECSACMASNCCDQIMACQADADCSCVTECIGMGGEPMTCFGDCGIDNPMAVEPLGALRMCQIDSCGDLCPGGGGGNMP